jgi:hypothetical protein
VVAYTLRYNHLYWVNAVSDDDYLNHSKQSVLIEAETDEEAIKKADEFLTRPTGQKWYPRAGGPEENLLNNGVELIKQVKVWH